MTSVMLPVSMAFLYHIAFFDGWTTVGEAPMKVTEIDYKTFSCKGNPFQSSFWAMAKRPAGWKPQAFVIEIDADGTVWTDNLLVLTKKFSPGMCLSYVPFGPSVFSSPMAPVEFLRDLSKELRKLLPGGVFAIRYDLPWDEPEEPNTLKIDGRRFRTSLESVQPEGTVRLDLADGYDAVAGQYRERARRNLRKARLQTKIEAWNGTKEDFDSWYEVYLETAKRDGFSARPKSYMRRLLVFSGKMSGDVRCDLYLARHKGKIVGGCMIIESPDIAVYLFGASLRFDDFSCSYALQDYAVRMACEHGCKVYDLHGIPGPGGRGAHLRGLDLFKRSFGGHAYYRTPSTDYVYRHIMWRIFTSGEKMRYRIHRHQMSPCLQSSGSSES